MTGDEREIAIIESDYIIDIAMWREIYPWLTQKRANEAADFLDVHNQQWRSNDSQVCILIETIQQLHPELASREHHARKKRQYSKGHSLGTIILLVLIIWILFKLAASGQTVVTNWVAYPASVRQFGVNIYDTARWPNVELPQYFIYRIDGQPYNGIPRMPLRIKGGSRGYLPPIITLTFNNFQYDPKAFAFENGPNFMRPAFPMYVKALMTDCRTNYSADGRMTDISRSYDCGLPLTNLLMVIKTNATK